MQKVVWGKALGGRRTRLNGAKTAFSNIPIRTNLPDHDLFVGTNLLLSAEWQTEESFA